MTDSNTLPEHINFLLFVIDGVEADLLTVTDQQAADQLTLLKLAAQWGQRRSIDNEASASFVTPDLILIQFISKADTSITAFASAYSATKH